MDPLAAPSLSPPPRRADEVLWLGVVALVAASHLIFALLDQRPPTDQVFLFSAVPVVRDALAMGQPGRLVGLLSESGGWYNLLVVGLLEAVGPSPARLRAFGMLASVFIVGLSGLLARRIAGPRAALAGAALAGATPMIVVWGRQVWFHVPEAALILGLLALVHGDPRLSRRGAPIGAALLGAAALTLRETGLFWMLTLLPVLLTGRGRRWLPVLALWLVAAWVPVSRTLPYLSNKLGARAHYAAQVAPFGEQLAFMVGWGVLVLGVVGVAAALWRRSGGPVDRLHLVLMAWLGSGPALVLLFHAGLDNHTLFAVGLAILGGVGLARLGLSRLAVALFLVYGALALAPEGSALAPARARVAAVLAPQRSEPIDDYARPWQKVRLDALRSSLSQCAPPCEILVYNGLFHPGSDSAGGTELWSLGVQARLVPVGSRPPRAMLAAHFGAAAAHRCADSASGDAALFTQLTAANGLVPLWERQVTRDCALVWWAPGP